MVITPRQKQILEGIVREYIKRAEPVSSQLIEKKYSLGICPATVRIEMQKLTDSGYLFQPHTSAGRVPTDKGYRFLVDNLLEKEISEISDFLEIKEILKKERDIFRQVSQLTKLLAKASSAFTIFSLLDESFSFREGWEEIVKEPEFENKDFISCFTNLIENFEKNIKNFKINSEVRVYIGKENPLKEAKDFSIILSKCNFPEKEKGIISILGPKRMPYQKNISLINSLMKVLKEC